jgi:[amino group carrier protein]-L-2-aminoadipate 6-kinase
MIIVKIGGGAAINLPAVTADLACLSEPVIVVHGANHARDRLASALGLARLTLTSAAGYTSTYSDEAAIDLLMMAYAGLRNKRIVELCQRQGLDAIGLCGLDGRLITGRRNAGIRTRQNGKTIIVRDFSGKPVHVRRELLTALLAAGSLPILTVPIADETGWAINAENDDIVALLQRDLGAETVLHLIEAPGLLADAGDPASLVARLSKAELGDWEKRLAGRMKRKLHALNAMAADTARIIIADGRGAHPVADALAGSGTQIA